MELQGRKIVVIGLAGSGVAAARFLAKAGARVIASDMKSADELKDVVASLDGLGIEFVLGGHPDMLFADASLVVTSPGVPRDSKPLQTAAALGVPVLSELAFAASLVQAPMLAVTGTNGKTTTVTLAGEIMKANLGADNVFVGGNIGTPFITLAEQGREVKTAVIEVSSFQLEYAPEFHPRAAVIINVTDDHLDRYNGFEDYAQTKWSIFANQTAEDFAVINFDDPVCARMVREMKPAVIAVSVERKARDYAMWIEGGAVRYALPQGAGELMRVEDVLLAGRHNLTNLMCAAGACLCLGADPAKTATAIRGFKGLHHRMEFTREFKGARWYNDSKGTNAGAVEAAVLGLDAPVILLMGGQAKGCHFTELGQRIAGRAKAVIAFGECKEQLREEIGPHAPVTVVNDIAEAVQAAAGMAAPGDAVILSPACASFDQFQNYKHRGETFMRLAKELK